MKQRKYIALNRKCVAAQNAKRDKNQQINKKMEYLCLKNPDFESAIV